MTPGCSPLLYHERKPDVLEDMQGRQDWLSLSGSTEGLSGLTTVGLGEGTSPAEGVRRWSSEKLNVQSKDQ